MCIINKIIIIFIFFTSSLFADANSSSNKNFVLGIDSSMVLSSELKDSKIALQLWIEELTKDKGFQVKVKYYQNTKKIIEAYLNEKSDVMALIDVLSYIKNKTILNQKSMLLWTFSYTENLYYQYYLIVNKESNIKTIKDIKDKRFIIKKNDTISKIWLDKLSYEQNHKSYKSLIKKQTEENKYSRAILQVYFNKADFTIVTKNEWDMMKEINPMIKSKIKIIEKSENIFIPVVGIGRKNTNKNFNKKFISTAQKAQSSARSQQIRALINFRKVFIIKEDFITDFEQFYWDYENLKKKYQ